MALTKTLIKAVTKFGPTAALAVIKYGPELRKLAEKNPQILEPLTARIKKLSEAAGSTSDASLRQRVDVLREQVTYLYASAQTADAARKASVWRTELEHITQTLPVVEAMSRKNRIVERRKISKNLDRISAEILAVSVEDIVEDAELL